MPKHRPANTPATPLAVVTWLVMIACGTNPRPARPSYCPSRESRPLSSLITSAVEAITLALLVFTASAPMRTAADHRFAAARKSRRRSPCSATESSSRRMVARLDRACHPLGSSRSTSWLRVHLEAADQALGNLPHAFVRLIHSIAQQPSALRPQSRERLQRGPEVGLHLAQPGGTPSGHSGEKARVARQRKVRRPKGSELIHTIADKGAALGKRHFGQHPRLYRRADKVVLLPSVDWEFQPVLRRLGGQSTSEAHGNDRQIVRHREVNQNRADCANWRPRDCCARAVRVHQQRRRTIGYGQTVFVQQPQQIAGTRTVKQPKPQRIVPSR